MKWRIWFPVCGYVQTPCWALPTRLDPEGRTRGKPSLESAAQGQSNSKINGSLGEFGDGPNGFTDEEGLESRTESALPQPRAWSRAEDSERDSPIDIRESGVSKPTKVGKDAGKGGQDGPGSKAECLVWTNNSGPGQWQSWNLLWMEDCVICFKGD